MDDDMDDDMDDSAICSGEIIQPALEGLASTFGVSYEELLPYFCEGFGVGEIKLALETAEKDVDMTWDELLEARRSAGWGEIWQELGLIGKDKEDNDNPEGGPENKGKPENHPGKGKGLDKKP
jgi:hypothetical protein